MTGVPETQAKPRELLAKLFEYRHELEAAEIHGDAITAKTALQLIRTQHRIIRKVRREFSRKRPKSRDELRLDRGRNPGFDEVPCSLPC